MISEIEIINYRNFKKIKFNPHKNINIFIGENGQGKTNLVEAIYFSSSNNSFRYYESVDLIHKEEKNALLKIKYEYKNNDFIRKIILNENSKTLLINEKKASFSSNYNHLPIIFFSPDSLSILKSSSSERRNFLDDFITMMPLTDRHSLVEFKKNLKYRNKVLNELSQNKSKSVELQELLLSIEENYLKLCTDLTVKRISILKKLIEFSQSYISELFETDGTLFFEYVAHKNEIKDFYYDQIFNIFKKRAQELRDAEIKMGTSLIGPHKHEINLIFNKKNVRSYCSQGQQRGIIMCLKIAQIVYYKQVFGDFPILILDDIFSELDMIRKKIIFKFIKGITSQVFITTTELSEELKQFDFKTYTIKKGEIR
jgi:DNA replication and repair protein RecF